MIQKGTDPFCTIFSTIGVCPLLYYFHVLLFGEEVTLIKKYGVCSLVVGYERE